MTSSHSFASNLDPEGSSTDARVAKRERYQSLSRLQYSVAQAKGSGTPGHRRPRFSFCIYNVKQLPEGPFAPRETAPTGRLARQLIIGLARISIDSTQMSMEQEKPAGQKCAPGLPIDPRYERCVYGPHRLVSKDFLDKKSFFSFFC